MYLLGLIPNLERDCYRFSSFPAPEFPTPDPRPAPWGSTCFQPGSRPRRAGRLHIPERLPGRAPSRLSPGSPRTPPLRGRGTGKPPGANQQDQVRCADIFQTVADRRIHHRIGGLGVGGPGHRQRHPPGEFVYHSVQVGSRGKVRSAPPLSNSKSKGDPDLC